MSEAPCRKTATYRTRLAARIALALMPDKGKRREQRAYWCREHRGYHLTSQEKRPWDSSARDAT